MKFSFLSAVIVHSQNPDALADFYRKTLGIRLVRSEHGSGEQPHYESELGDVHFAIFPAPNESEPQTRGSVTLAFAIKSMDKTVALLEAQGIPLEFEVQSRGFAKLTAIADPDGNTIKLTELSESWLEHLQSRPKHHRDIVLAMQLSGEVAEFSPYE